MRKEYIEKADQAGSKLHATENSDKDRVIDSLRKTITNLVDKGTKTTLGDDEKRGSITSLEKIGEKSSVKKGLGNEISIIGFLTKTPIKEVENEWDEYPIIKEESQEKKSESYGYVILPHGRRESDTKSYKIIEDKENETYLIKPIHK